MKQAALSQTRGIQQYLIDSAPCGKLPGLPTSIPAPEGWTLDWEPVFYDGLPSSPAVFEEEWQTVVASEKQRTFSEDHLPCNIGSVCYFMSCECGHWMQFWVQSYSRPRQNLSGALALFRKDMKGIEGTPFVFSNERLESLIAETSAEHTCSLGSDELLPCDDILRKPDAVLDRTQALLREAEQKLKEARKIISASFRGRAADA